ncbi:MAG: MFS transporter [Firmicutes bacterium]|nr:MFS transporter [Bacillota bacterium]
MPSTMVAQEKRRALRLNIIEGAFAVASDNLAGPYLTLFAISLGATPSQIGMLSAFPSLLGNILQIPFGVLTEKIRDRRYLCIIGGFLSRTSWLLVGFLPFLLPPEKRIAFVILLASLRIVAANMGSLAWTSLQAGLVPRQIRGKYYANRNVVLNLCALLATFAAGYFLEMQFPTNYHILFIGAAILGVISTVLFVVIPFPPVESKKPEPGQTTKAQLKAFRQLARGNQNYMNYVWSAIVWSFGVSFAASLNAVHFVHNLGGNDGTWALVTAASLASTILCQRYWGRLSDKFGPKNIMVVSGFFISLLPILWFLAPVSWFAIIISFINGFVWGGYNLAAFNLILEITPDENRPLYIGTINTFTGLASAVGPALGGFAAEIIGLRPVFLISAVLQFAGLAMFRRGVNDTGYQKPTRHDFLPIFRRSTKMMHRS